MSLLCIGSISTAVQAFEYQTLTTKIQIYSNEKMSIAVEPLQEPKEMSYITVDKMGEIVLKYQEPGDYEYLVSQDVKNTQDAHKKYDLAKYHILVSVTDKKGELYSAVAVTSLDTSTKPDKIRFVNERDGDPEASVDDDSAQAGNKPGNNGKMDNVRSGDENATVLWVVISTSSLALLAIAFLIHKRRRQRSE